MAATVRTPIPSSRPPVVHGGLLPAGVTGLASWVAIALLACGVCGCAATRTGQPAAAVPAPAAARGGAGDDAHARMEFWSELGRRPVVANADAFRALLLYLDGGDPAADYAGRVAALKGRGLLAAGFDRPADEPADRGTLAVAFAQALGVRGGLTMQVLGPSPRYAVRALEYRRLFPPSSPNQAFTGPELVGVFGRVEDYQRGNPADAPAALLPGEIVRRAGETPGLVGSTVVSPTDEGGDAPGDAPDGEPAALPSTRPLLLNVLDTTSAAAWWQQPPVDTQPAAPAGQPVPTKDKPVKLKAIITGVEGDLAEVRKSDADPWARAKVGMSVGEAAEFRTGPKSAIRFVIPPDHVYTVDRQGSVKLLQLVYDGRKLSTDVGMQQGRVRLDVAKIAAPVPTKTTTPDGKPDEPAYRIFEAGVEHDSTIRSPNTALAVRGTVVSLLDEPPFPPEAVSLTGRAAYRNPRRQVVAFGGVGAGKTVVRGDQSGAGEEGLSKATTPATPVVGQNDFFAQTTALVLRKGRAERGDVVSGSSGFTDAELATRAPLPGLEFTLRWDSTPNTSDLNLVVFSPLHSSADPDFVGNPPAALSLMAGDPKAEKTRAELYPRTSRSGGRISKNHIGPAGLEFATWGKDYPVGNYRIVVYNGLDAATPPAETVNPISYKLDVFLNRRRLVIPSIEGSVGDFQISRPVAVPIPATPAATAQAATVRAAPAVAATALPPDEARRANVAKATAAGRRR